MLLLGVSGSLRRDSHNTALLRAALELAPPGVAVDRFEGLALVPPFNADDEPGDGHAGLVAWRGAIARADAVLFATPEYNSSIPGQLKNAVDWASRPPGGSVLQGKPVAVMSNRPASLAVHRCTPSRWSKCSSMRSPSRPSPC